MALTSRISLALGAVLAALTAALLGATGAQAAIEQKGITYDLDGSGATNPARLGQLDLYRPDGLSPTASRPVVVYVHGGGWRGGDKSNSISRKVNLFTGAGYVFASVNYRLSPNPTDLSYPPSRVRFPVHPTDVGEAVAWIDRNVSQFGGDPSRILLIGHSAGAQIVSLVSTNPSYLARWGTDPAKVRGTVALDGDAYDVADRIDEVPSRTKPLYYSAFGTPEENAAENSWALASAETWADPADTDQLFVTQARSAGRIADAREMASRLGQDPAGSVFLAPYDHEGINDAVGSPTDGSGETQAILDFFARQAGGLQLAPSKVRLTKRPGNRVEIRRGNRAKVTFRFGAKTEASAFRCRVDRSPFRRCRSPKRLRLKKGHHTFAVAAVGLDGAVGEARKIGFRVVDRRR